ncbi:MAG: endo-1,4-beta-xylanase [Defluviitaleaceae bacterium]|nr:endo-1,4-beta-xylanase [Defluviitaleaceae bacterium]
MLKKTFIACAVIIGLSAGLLVFAGCTPENEYESEYENDDAVTMEEEPEPTPRSYELPGPPPRDPEVTADLPPCPTTIFTPTEGSISMRIETMGSVQWDGAQVPIEALGLELEGIYEISFDIFTPLTEGDVETSILVQTSGPLWRHIIPTRTFYAEDEMEWHSYEGILDLRGVNSLPSYVQIVKNSSGPNPNTNVLFYIDNFIVTRESDGEQIAMFNFEDNTLGPWHDSGQAILMTGVASPEVARMPVPEWDMGLPSLAARWSDYFILGNIIEPHQLQNNTRGVIEMFLHHYAAVTAENAMKVDAISGGGNQRTRPANLFLDNARMVVDFATDNDLYMVGHTLVWHSQSAPWLYRDQHTGDYLTRAEAKENMRWFIEQYAGYFGDRIDAWDVTNEVFTNGGGANIPSQGPEDSPIYDAGTWQRALRNYVPWYNAFANGADFDAGERAYDYIYYAFVFARRYAPNALLIYNDFNEEAPHKRNAMANMTEALNERWHSDSENNPAYGNPNHRDYGRLLIEVIGMQAHYNSGTDLDRVREAIERFAQTGARIHVTELDIHFGGQMQADFVMGERNEERQAVMFAQLFQWYEEFSDYIDRVTIWGREDASSWRGYRGATHFDRFYRAKPAFWAIYDPENWRDRIN